MYNSMIIKYYELFAGGGDGGGGGGGGVKCTLGDFITYINTYQ